MAGSWGRGGRAQSERHDLESLGDGRWPGLPGRILCLACEQQDPSSVPRLGLLQPALQVEAFMFGSVPLRTYLPDGDIDISVFSSPNSRDASSVLSLKDTWANQLLKALEAEQARSDAPFKIRDLQIIQAEVGGPLGLLLSGPLLLGPNLSLRSCKCTQQL